jgi:hypothetical protein
MTTLTCIAPLDPAQPALGPLLDCATRDVTFARRTGHEGLWAHGPGKASTPGELRNFNLGREDRPDVEGQAVNA